MLGVLCARPKPWILTSLSLCHGHAAAADRPFHTPVQFGGSAVRRRRHSSACCKLDVSGGGAASIWHAITPSGGESRWPTAIHHEQRGDGSWNAAWDARPARWLHSPDSAWLLFGVCACVAPLVWPEESADVAAAPVEEEEATEGSGLNCCDSGESNSDRSAGYRVTGVLADGRCLFRAIAHCACLRNGEEAPDENRERELADDLRAKVVDELLRRREETEYFIEGDFDAYVKQIRQPCEWGGEPELLMASHVLKTPISVFKIDKSSGSLEKIADYGNIYHKDNDSPINVLFHGYGHYDILETSPDQSCQKLGI